MDPADDLASAARALDGRDLRHALTHLARAFALAPADERLHALLETAALRGDLLAALPDDRFVGTALVRAWAMRRAGRVREAVALLGSVLRAAPHLGFETVLATWLSVASASETSLTTEALMPPALALAWANESTIGLHRLRDGDRALLAGYGQLALALIPFADLWQVGAVIASGTLRRCGHLAEARSLAEGAVPAEGRNAGVQVGLAWRAGGDGARAAEVFAKLRKAEPYDRVLLGEEARSHFVAGDAERARSMLGDADPEDSELRMLARACNADLGSEDRVDVLDRIRRTVLAPPVVTPSDATANLVRHGVAQGYRLESAAGSGWESPSNRLMLAVATGRGNDVAAAAYSSIPSPGVDGLTPRREGGVVLWELRDGAVVQAVPDAMETLKATLALAAQETHFEDLWDAAQRIGRATSRSDREEIVSALVHVPSDPRLLGPSPVEALYRYQVAGACALASTPGGWAELGPVFEGLLFGPVDWASAAAVTALGELARRDAEAARPARALLMELIDDLLPHSCDPRFGPLYWALKRLPAVPEDAGLRLDAWRREFVDGEADEPPEVDRRNRADATFTTTMPAREPEPDPSPAPVVAPTPSSSIAQPTDDGSPVRLLVLAAVVVVVLATYALTR